MIADYFNIRIDLMEMDNNALVAYAKTMPWHWSIPLMS